MKHVFTSESGAAAARKVSRDANYRNKIRDSKSSHDRGLTCMVCEVWFCAVKYDRGRMRPTMQRASCSSVECKSVLRELAGRASGRKRMRVSVGWKPERLPDPTTP